MSLFYTYSVRTVRVSQLTQISLFISALGGFLNIISMKSMLQNGESYGNLRSLNLSIANKDICKTQLGQNIESGQICAVGSQEKNACFVSIKNTFYSLFKTYHDVGTSYLEQAISLKEGTV
jgi:hypothetical protein